MAERTVTFQARDVAAGWDGGISCFFFGMGIGNDIGDTMAKRPCL